MSIKVSVPGKLFLAGEYAVVEPGFPAVLMAVDRYLTMTITMSEQGLLHSNQQEDLWIDWWREEEDLRFPADQPYGLVAHTMQLVEEYVRAVGRQTSGYYRLEISSQLDDEQTGAKYGLGSSGAVTVATVRALLAYYNLPVSNLMVFKLAALSHILLDKKGSFGDMAASSFGGYIFYQSCDRHWVKEELSRSSLIEVLEMDWQGLRIEPIELPAEMSVFIGWTGQVALTDQLLEQTQQSPVVEQEYQQFLQDSRACVESFVAGCSGDDVSLTRQALAVNRTLLQGLARLKGFTIETPALATLCYLAEQEGAVAKTSGAGGGDCGICLVETNAQKERIAEAWKKVGIVPLAFSVAPNQ